MTNWWPMIRIAWRTARRITGSPTRPTRRLKALWTSRLVSSARSTRWPVSIRPQVEALTSTESDWPMWRLPVGLAELVADQLVGGVRVGDAQQRFGHAHQQHAFLAAEVVLAHEGFDRALVAGRGRARGGPGRRRWPGRRRGRPRAGGPVRAGARTWSASSRTQPAVIAARGPLGGGGQFGADQRASGARRGRQAGARPVGGGLVVIGPAGQPWGAA